MCKKTLKKVASIALPIAGGYFGPVGAAIGGAVAGGVSGGGLKGVALGGVKGYAGNVIGDSIGKSLTSGLSKVGASNAVTNSVANTTLGRLASNVVGPATGSSLIGNVAGSFAGNSIASGLVDAYSGIEPETASEQTPLFNPTRQSQLDLPGSLGGFSGLNEDQVSTNLATQGVYGGGNGPEEQAYFNNLINRRLIDDSGAIDQDLSEITPIESSYLAQMGLGGYSNSRDLLEALSKWRPT